MSHDHDFGPGTWSADLGGSHVVFGAGCLARLGELAAALPSLDSCPTPDLGLAAPRRALVVTDPGIEAAGHAARAVAALAAHGLSVQVFDGVEENPTTEHVARGVDAARAHGADLLVGLGGGSAMDCCKGINFLYTQGGAMEDYWGVGKATKPMLPSIGVPTTAGTGSEAQRFALVSQVGSHRKMACGDRKARFRTVVLDPDLIATVPRKVAAVTGVDALSHAVESHVSQARSPVSQMFSREAFRLLERSFETYLDDPSDAAARGDMLLGAHLAGAAIETSMLGAAHSLANPLTARYDITHGIAVGLVLPHVVRFNGSAVDRAVEELYGDLSGTARLNGQLPPGSARLARRLEELTRAAGLPAGLDACGVDRAQLPALASEAAEQWTARFNPRQVAADDLAALYEAAYEANQ